MSAFKLKSEKKRKFAASMSDMYQVNTRNSAYLKPFTLTLNNSPSYFFCSGKKNQFSDKETLLEENLKLKYSRSVLHQENLKLKRRIESLEKMIENHESKNTKYPQNNFFVTKLDKIINKKASTLSEEISSRDSIETKANQLRIDINTDVKDFSINHNENENLISKLETTIKKLQADLKSKTDILDKNRTEAFAFEEQLDLYRNKAYKYQNELFFALDKIRRLEKLILDSKSCLKPEI